MEEAQIIGSTTAVASANGALAGLIRSDKDNSIKTYVLIKRRSMGWMEQLTGKPERNALLSGKK